MRVTVSSKFQVVIPREIRNKLKIRPGEKAEMFSYEDRIELLPLKKIEEMRGFLRGMETTIEREDERL